jgi:hypothetical protein
MTNRHRLICAMGLLLLFTAALSVGANAQTAASISTYRFNAPPGWIASREGDIDVLTPQSEPAGTVQVLLMPRKPAVGDFESQFSSERVELEKYWGLRAPAPVAPQRGQSASGPYAAYFASYDSDGGARYMSFLGKAQQQRFAMVVFVAASHEHFNRHAASITDLFKELSW